MWIKLHDWQIRGEQVKTLSDAQFRIYYELQIYAMNQVVPGLLLTPFGAVANEKDLAEYIGKSCYKVETTLYELKGRGLVKRIYLSGEKYGYVVTNFIGSHQARWERYDRRFRAKVKKSRHEFLESIRAMLDRPMDGFLEELYTILGVKRSEVTAYVRGVLSEDGEQEEASPREVSQDEPPAKQLPAKQPAAEEEKQFVMDPYIEEHGGIRILARIYNKYRGGKMPEANIEKIGTGEGCSEYGKWRYDRSANLIQNAPNQIQFIKDFARAVQIMAKQEWFNGTAKRCGEDRHKDYVGNFDFFIRNQRRVSAVLEGSYGELKKHLIRDGETPRDIDRYQ